ncbi:MAG: DUF4384 domain-containing protein [Desulfobacteraceae bacterium]|nr:DUF4384 domain-containing protein [Desulfobacteraceae bacterium]
MKVFRIIICLAISVLFLSGALAGAASPSETDRKDLKLRLAFCAIRGISNPPKVEPVTKNMTLASGDKLKVLLEFSRKCFVYLIHENAQGEVALLFPYSIKQFDTDYQTSRKYTVPKGEAWFQLDTSTGLETFYLLASDQRLLDVEYMYQQYASAKPPEKAELAGRMVSEIRGMGEKYFASAEKGQILVRNDLSRGFERATGADLTDISGFTREIAFKSFFTETFVVEHR